jgi:TetR/AcrR family transcriptional regulator
MPKSARPSSPLEEDSPKAKRRALEDSGPAPATRAARALETRERILQTAIRLFSQKGYDGASVDEIVSGAKINKRMVYHYFKNKEGLYAAALAAVFERLANVEAEIFHDHPSADLAIERIATVYFEFLHKNPEFIALLHWENLQGGKHLKALPASVTKAPILDSLGRVIEEGIASGQIRPEIDKRHMLINLIGICMIYFSNRHTLSRTVGLDLENPATLNEGLKHALALIRHGFLNAAP